MAIFLTSDMHFGHDREFIWKARGYSSIEEMNEDYVEKWNSVISDEDDVYILGDLMLGEPSNIEYINESLDTYKKFSRICLMLLK